MNLFHKIIFPIFFLCINIFAQYGEEAWVRTFTNSDSTAQPVSIVFDSLGNVYQTGFAVIPTFTPITRIVTIKYNSKGEQQWHREYDGYTNEWPTSMAVDNRGNIIVAGYAYTSDSTGYDYIIIKYSSNGIEEWSRTINGEGNGDDKVINIVPDNSSNIFITGVSNGTNNYDDILTLKLDPFGNILWTERFDELVKFQDKPWHLVLDDSSNAYIVGTVDSAKIRQDIIILKYGNSGQLLWQRRYSRLTDSQEIPFDCSTDIVGNIYICASSSNSTNESSILLKYKSNGELDQEIIYNAMNNSTNVPSKISVDKNQNVYVLEHSVNSDQYPIDFTIVKYDSTGNLKWSRILPTSDIDDFVMENAFLDKNGTVYLLGWTEKNFVTTVITRKFNSNGTIDWTHFYSRPNTLSNVPDEIIVDNSNVFVSGWIGGEPESWGAYLLIEYARPEEAPKILTVHDVPNDQGGWVNVAFVKSVYDTNSLKLAKTTAPELYTIEMNNGNGWMPGASSVAYGKYLYSTLVHTMEDSTSQSKGLINFRVIAGMNGGNFVSDSMTGYSVDNQRPPTPQSLSCTINEEQFIQLNWKPVTDKDLQNYQIFRSDGGSTFAKINSTVDTFYVDKEASAEQTYYYFVNAVNYSGNESDKSDIVNIVITGISDKLEIPSHYYLSQNYPNPFNPSTTIKYGLLKRSKIKIIIYDILGHEIRKLVNGELNAGQHQVVWNGKNQSGQNVSSGVYYYRMQTEEFTSFKKMLYLK